MKYPSLVCRVPMAILALAAVTTGCAKSKSTTPPPTTSTAVPTTIFVTTSTAVTTTSTTAAPTTTVAPTTTAAPIKRFPLTGLPVGDSTTADRPALVVKINNAFEARPQAGLNQADIVIEEIVEGITRFMAVFHSTDADKIGSIRSARTSDLDLLKGLGKPMFAWSGANNYVSNAVRSLPNIIDIGFDRQEGLYSIGRRLIDYTEFFISSNKAYENVVWVGAPPAPALFSYRTDGSPVSGGKDLDKIEITLDGTRAGWTWDAGSGTWLRSTDGQKHNDLSGKQLFAANVVVAFSNYRTSPADPKSPEAVSVGKGPLWVLTGGKWIKGTWTRETSTSPYTLTDTAGAPILLTPGKTFLELPRTEQAANEP